MTIINTRVNNIYRTYTQPTIISHPTFCGLLDCDADSFTKEKHNSHVTMWNPYTMELCSDSVFINKAKSQDIMLESLDSSGKKNSIMFHYNPDMTDYLKDKKTGAHIKTIILKSENPHDKTQFTYHFMSDDFTKEYGFVCMSEHLDKSHKNSDWGKFTSYLKNLLSHPEPNNRQDIAKNYTNPTLEGNRLEIEYIQNNYPNEIKGIGNLSDELAVKYCHENEIQPNIVFYSMNNSHIQNYMRGNRFLPLEKGSKQQKYFIETYNTDDVNKVMSALLKKHTTKDINTEQWGDLGMYIPKEHSTKLAKNYVFKTVKLNNPFETSEVFSNKLYIDMSKPRIFNIYGEDGTSVSANYNPKRTGFLINKKTEEPFEVNILRIKDYEDDDREAFLFMSKDLNTEYGYVELDKAYDTYDEDLEYDYPEYGIVGDRVVVSYLKNNQKAKIGGVGKLADRVAVQYCIENDINPRCIISHAAEGSHVAHYKRGKRFIPPKKSELEHKHLMDNYKNSNPNKILKMLIRESEKNGEPVDIKGWGELGLKMYLPKELVDKYSKEKFEGWE